MDNPFAAELARRAKVEADAGASVPAPTQAEPSLGDKFYDELGRANDQKFNPLAVWMGARKPRGRKMSDTERTVRQVREAVTRGGISLSALPVDLLNLGMKGGDWALEKLGVPEDTFQPEPIYTGSSQYYTDKAQQRGLLGDPEMKPTTTAGRYAQKAVQGAVEGSPFGIPGMVGGATSSMAHKFARDNKLGTTAEIIASLAGGYTGGRLPGTVSKTANAITGKKSQLVDDYIKEGVTPRLAGDITGGNGTQRLQTALGDTMTGGGTMRNAAGKTIDEVESAVKRAANKMGKPVGTQDAGQKILDASNNWLNRFKSSMNRAYKKVDYHYKKTDPVDLSNTQQALDDVMLAMPDAQNTAKQLTSDFFRELRKNLDADIKAAGTGNSLTYESVKRIRTEIGAKLANPQIIDDVDRAQLKKLYGALSDDVINSATSPHAKRRIMEANDVARKGYEKLEDTYAKIINKGAEPETIFRYATGQMSSGGTRLSKIREGFTPEEWSVVGATVLNRLGRAKDGAQNAAGDVFSVNTYLTNWNKISPEAKKALFGKGQFQDLPASLDRLARIADSMKSTTKLANSSKTAGTAEVIRLLTLQGGGYSAFGPVGVAAGTGLSVATPWVASKLMTSPAFVRWLSVPSSLKQLPKRAIALQAVINNDPSIETEVKTLQKFLKLGNN